MQRHPSPGRLVAAATAAALTVTSLMAASPAAAAAADSAGAAPAVTGTTYYVDSVDGNDAASGQGPDDAWRSLDRVNSQTFQPGDAILLEAGDTWSGQLWPKGSGTDAEPITVAAYGDGAKPRIQAAGLVDDAVRLFNQSHWVIRDLDVSNQRTGGATAADNLADLRGIHVSGDDSQTLSGFVIDGVDVHDVTGQVNWIGGSVSDNAPGIRFQTGWDGSKRTGGIVFDTTVPDIHHPPARATVLDDVIVENSTVVNTSFAGIVVKQYTGDGRDAGGNLIAVATGWGTRENATDPKFTPHTNFVIRGNYIRQDGTDYGCNGMYLTNLRGAVVEDNVVYRTGTSGMEMYYAADITVQHNEVYETQQKAGGADSNGIDPDKGTTGIVVQYNYVHGNGDGILICQFAFGDSVIRDNVIADNKRYPIYLHSDRPASAKVYRNTIYNSVSSYLIYGYGSSLNATYDIRDNVIHSTKANATLTTSPTITYDNNLYSGTALTIPGDAHALVGDAAFVNAQVSGPYGTAASGPQLATANGYAPTAGSKAVNTGSTANADDGGLDYRGQPSRVGAPDVGAFEYATASGATTEAVSGTVLDGTGAPVRDAAVTVTSGPVVRTATSDATGWFAVAGVPFGTATVGATRTGWASSPTQVDVGTGTSSLVRLVMESTATDGVVAGRVADVTGRPLAGATVDVLSGQRLVASTTSGADGGFVLPEVPIGEDYAVAAHAESLRPDSVEGVDVGPASTTTVRTLILQPRDPAAIYQDDVEARPVGTFASQDGYTVSQSGGSVTVADLAPGRAFRLNRTTNTGSTSLARSYATPLTGIVTIESRVMRNDALAPSNANWFSVPYLYGSNGAVAVAVAFSKGKIVAYQGTASTELMPYASGRWYTLTLVVDTANQRFDLRVDGVEVVDQATFRNPLQGGIAKIEYYANSSNYGTTYVDDLRILQGSERDRGNAAIASLTTDVGPVAQVDDSSWRMDVPATTTAARVTVVPAADAVTGITVAGVAVDPGVPSAPVDLVEGANTIAIVVTAENGTQRQYTLTIQRAPLDADATLAALVVGGGALTPAFDPSTTDYDVTLPTGTARLTVTATPAGPRSVITVAGSVVANGSATTVGTTDGAVVEVGVQSADGTATETYRIAVHVPDPAPPARGTLSTTSGWSGLADGNFDVNLDLWWGQNARELRLLQDGVLIASVPLTYGGLGAQHATVPVHGLLDGSYVFTGELVNNVGSTATTSVTVRVTQAAPGKPAPRADGWTGATRTLVTDLWWGTNATEYELWQDGALVDSRELVAATPSAQHVETTVTGLAAGRHEFVSVLRNGAGQTRSDVVVVTIR